MKLKNLKIKGFKNLSGPDGWFEIDFEKTTSVLIGANASGKSSLLEIISIIFKNLLLKKDPNPKYEFEISYEINGKNISVKTEEKRGKLKYSSNIDSKEDLPSFVVSYYSGSEKRLFDIFDDHISLFRKDLLADKLRPIRELFYCESIHFKLLLVSLFYNSKDIYPSFLKNKIGINKLIKIKFFLKAPSWKKPKTDFTSFWGAGGYTGDHLNELKQYCDIDSKNESLIFSNDQLQNLYDDYNIIPDREDFFKLWDSIFVNDLLKKVEVSLDKEGVESKVSHLSEGEMQLITVYGILEILSGKNVLLLFDEPDTYLHPAWQRKFLDELISITKNLTVHTLITTHSPLLIQSVQNKESEILLMKNNALPINIEEERLLGYRIDQIITDEELFGLESARPIYLDKFFKKRRELLSKQEFTKEDESEVKKLEEKCGGIPSGETIEDMKMMQFLHKKAKELGFNDKNND